MGKQLLNVPTSRHCTGYEELTIKPASALKELTVQLLKKMMTQCCGRKSAYFRGTNQRGSHGKLEVLFPVD